MFFLQQIQRRRQSRERFSHSMPATSPQVFSKTGASSSLLAQRWLGFHVSLYIIRVGEQKRILRYGMSNTITSRSYCFLSLYLPNELEACRNNCSGTKNRMVSLFKKTHSFRWHWNLRRSFAFQRRARNHTPHTCFNILLFAMQSEWFVWFVLGKSEF